MLAFQHVGQRLQVTVAGSGHRAAVAPIVQQRVDRFLQHALFIADDDFRRFQLQEVTQAVIAVDDAAVEVIQVGGRKAAAVQRH